LSMVVVILIEKRKFRALERMCRQSSPQSLRFEQEDEDVSAERERVEQNFASSKDDKIQLLDLHKVFKTRPDAGNKVAVNALTLGVPQGQIFGLLGATGAGKTTTLRMITGDTYPSSGDGMLDGASILNPIDKMYQSLGYCPQENCLIDLLTGREHLLLYARIKGIKTADAKQSVDKFITALELGDHADKPTAGYSAGTKRKFTLSLSLLGLPRILLLDEPSRGLDPAARHAMWDLISAEIAGRTAIIATHSMEEADRLCHRIGILVNGQLKCLGSGRHLKAKFGSGYDMEIRTRPDEKSMEAVKTLIRELIPESKLVLEFASKLRFSVPHVDLPLSKVFRELERMRDALFIADYSMSQTTLEQVFLGFVKDQELDIR